MIADHCKKGPLGMSLPILMITFSIKDTLFIHIHHSWKEKNQLSKGIGQFQARSGPILSDPVRSGDKPDPVNTWTRSVLFCYAFMHVCLLMPCGRLLDGGGGGGGGLASWLSFVMSNCDVVTPLSLSHWYPGSGVVLGCIVSWSLPSSLLCLSLKLCTGLSVTDYSVLEGVAFWLARVVWSPSDVPTGIRRNERK